MQLADPIYLWTLAGLLIPLAIHLLSRKAGQVVRIGSIRHLVDSNTRKFSSIRFNEYGLFALRGLAVILFVLLLSGLTYKGHKPVPKWVLLEMEPGTVPGLQKSLDSLQDAGYELRYLTEGFPMVTVPVFRGPPVNYSYLAQCLEQADVEAIVYARNRLNAFRGRQRPLPRKVRWLQLSGESRESVLKASRAQLDTTWLLRGVTGPERTVFSRSLESIPANQISYIDIQNESDVIPIQPQPSIKVFILADKTMERPAGMVDAALRAIGDFSGEKITIEKASELPASLRQYDYIFNFIPDLPLKETEAVSISLQKQKTGPILIRTGSNTWQISQALNRQSILGNNLLIELGKLLLEDKALEKNIQTWDQRTVDESVLFSGEPPLLTSSSLQQKSLDKYLIFGLILVFIFERILAFYRHL